MNSISINAEQYYLIVIRIATLTSTHPYKVLSEIENVLLTKGLREEVVKELKRNSDNIRWTV